MPSISSSEQKRHAVPLRPSISYREARREHLIAGVPVIVPAGSATGDGLFRLAAGCFPRSSLGENLVHLVEQFRRLAPAAGTRTIRPLPQPNASSNSGGIELTSPTCNEPMSPCGPTQCISESSTSQCKLRLGSPAASLPQEHQAHGNHQGAELLRQMVQKGLRRGSIIKNSRPTPGHWVSLN
jgi:hypothetical protein